jgi:thymidylate synthase (FAD)
MQGYTPEFVFEIEKVFSGGSDSISGEYVDAMQGLSCIKAKVDEHGYVALMDVMPRLVPKGRTADFCVPQAARTSTGNGCKTVAEDIGLVR